MRFHLILQIAFYSTDKPRKSGRAWPLPLPIPCFTPVPHVGPLQCPALCQCLKERCRGSGVGGPQHQAVLQNPENVNFRLPTCCVAATPFPSALPKVKGCVWLISLGRGFCFLGSLTTSAVWQDHDKLWFCSSLWLHLVVRMEAHFLQLSASGAEA